MEILELTQEELKAFTELNTILMGIVIEDPDISPDIAKSIVEKARLLQNCQAFDKEQRDQYGKVVQIFLKLSGN